jgi:hypothetical protein
MAQPDAATMRKLVQQGKAMPAPGQDRPGRFQIRNADELAAAIKAVGLVQPPTDEARAKVRMFIMQRAKALGLNSAIPDSWNADGSLKDDSGSGNSSS